MAEELTTADRARDKIKASTAFAGIAIASFVTFGIHGWLRMHKVSPWPAAFWTSLVAGTSALSLYYASQQANEWIEDQINDRVKKKNPLFVDLL